MKRIHAWFSGLAGIAALRHRLARRRRSPAPVELPSETAPAEDPAEELRRKLADARRAEPEHDPEPQPQPQHAEETLDERRARVHAKAREAIEAMGDDEGPR